MSIVEREGTTMILWIFHPIYVTLQQSNNTYLSSLTSTEEITVRVSKGPACLGPSPWVPYEAYSLKDLVFVAIPIKSKYLVSPGVIQNGTNSCETSRQDECANHVLYELKTALKVLDSHATRAINDKTKVKFSFAN